MINGLREIEDAYMELFCQKQAFSNMHIFSNNAIPGMYCHNFVLFQDVAKQEDIKEYISNCLREMKSEEKGFLKFVFHPNIKVSPEILEWAEEQGFEVSYIKYMCMPAPSDIAPAEESSCIVKRAQTSDEIEMGLACAAQYETSPIGEKKLRQKRELYLNQSLSYYVCYVDGSPVGYCDNFVKDGIVKLEEFVVLDQYQGKGYGTKMLHKMLSDAVIQGSRYVYVVTDAQEKEHNLYYKMGFDFVGEEAELFFIQ